MSELGERLRRAGLRVEDSYPIGRMTTYRAGGPARWFVEIASCTQLDALAACRPAATDPVCVIGKGSNLLVSDRGFAGLALALGDAFAAVRIEETRVVAGAAAALPVVARKTAAAGLTGFEWAVGVPGSVGGAIRMNAGGHGSDMAAVLESASIVSLADGARRDAPAAELAMDYRATNLSPSDLVRSAKLSLARGVASESERLIGAIVRWRREHQPGGQNAGSVFTNPPGDSAGRLIDEAGCKGLRIGTAEVSPKHANFIQADDGARAIDILALMREVRRRVRENSGIDLHPETQLLGFDPDELA